MINKLKHFNANIYLNIVKSEIVFTILFSPLSESPRQSSTIGEEHEHVTMKVLLKIKGYLPCLVCESLLSLKSKPILNLCKKTHWERIELNRVKVY